ncbi:hypothetical protein AB0I53_43725 [Saccharopolyspora sp. NPDC050389]|uniref:hypothetical protein n=1 Tax=Saccharopolyspora sp. NPDC050389 TaxID=3155516 RepID=UPI0033E63EB4
MNENPASPPSIGGMLLASTAPERLRGWYENGFGVRATTTVSCDSATSVCWSKSGTAAAGDRGRGLLPGAGGGAGRVRVPGVSPVMVLAVLAVLAVLVVHGMRETEDVELVRKRREWLSR